MAAEVSADLNQIQDEDVLRRMWADTEDFGKKKEIRARMYKLREQRLKDFYTTGEVVTEITGRKHATKTHTESIGDQGFLTMKTKEIRDSESPTRDFNRRGGNGYWSTVEESGYTTGSRDDGALVEVKEQTRRSEGKVTEGNTETRIVTAGQQLHEKAEKADENSSMRTEKTTQNKAFATDSVTVGEDGVSRLESAEKQSKQQSREERTSQSSSQTTKYSTSSSSSKKVVSSSSSKSATYVITPDGQRKLVSETELKAITGGGDSADLQSNLRSESKVKSDSSARERNVHEVRDNQTNIQSGDIITYDDGYQLKNDRNNTVHDSKNVTTSYETRNISNQAHTSKTSSSTKHSSYVVTNNQMEIQNLENQNQLTNVTSTTGNDIKKDTKITSDISIQNQSNYSKDNRDTYNYDQSRVKESNDFITNEKIDVTKTSDTIQKYDGETIHRTSQKTDSLRNTDSVQQNTNESQTSTNQRILTEIQKLDTYLHDQQTPTTSEPVTPKSVTDGANWTVVSNKGGEFVYQDDKAPVEPKKGETYEYQPREPMVKHPSSLDLPKEATDGQYVTTYQQSYNRISVDNSPSHQYFMTTLRASPLSPDRLTPSPTKTSRGSLDRSSPERRLRTNSRGSLDRSSPDTSKRRSYSKGSLDRTSPDRPYRASPTKSVDKERRGSGGSYTIEKRKDTRRKTTEITQSTLQDTTTKPKRKFSSTQQKAANKARASTPGTSPSTSPTRRIKDTTSGSESDISQATYNKTTSISSFQDANITTREDVNIDTSSKRNVTVTRKEQITDVLRREREKSPEYSSEGSVSREVKKSIIKPQITTTENSAFRPIKPTKETTHEDVSNQFITEEQTYLVKHHDKTIVDHSNDKREDNTQTCTITEITDDLNDIEQTQPVPRDVPDSPRDQPTPSKGLINVPKRTSSPVKKHSTPASSPDRKPSSDVSTGRGPRDRPKSTSPSKPTTSPSRRQPSVSPERHSPTRNIKKISSRSPSVSPERRTSKSKQTVTETRHTKTEGRRSVSSSPSPTRRPLVDTQNIQNNTITSRKFIKEETRFTKKSSDTTSPVRREQLKDKIPTRKPQHPDKLSSPQRKQIPTTGSVGSPKTAKSIPSPKTKLPEPKRDGHATRTQPRKTETTTISNTITKTSHRFPQGPGQSPRESSIPRANKPLSPKNSKDKIENLSVTKTTITVKRTSSIPRQHITTRTVTRQSNDSTERRPLAASTPQRKPVSPNERTTPATRGRSDVPKSALQRVEGTTTRRQVSQRITSVQTTAKPQKVRGTPTKSPTVQKSPRPPKITETTDTQEITIFPEKNEIRINNEFISEERMDTINLEDENPPDEFFAEYDDSSPERNPKPEEKSKPQKPEPAKGRNNYASLTTKETNEKNKTIKQVTSKKVTKRRKSLKDTVSSSSSSSSEDEGEEPKPRDATDSGTGTKSRPERDTTHASNQDLLTVIVQHPKSSRESSPGKVSAPFCTTSEDGESNPRYADFVSEPEDVEVFDKLTGPSGPVRLTDETDSTTVPSVAERVNVFLGNTRVSQETTVKREIKSEAPKSVLKRKHLFENIAKNQSSTVQQDTNDDYDLLSEEEVTIRRLDERDSHSVQAESTTSQLEAEPRVKDKQPIPNQVKESPASENIIHTNKTNVDQFNSQTLIENEILTSQIVQENLKDDVKQNTDSTDYRLIDELSINVETSNVPHDVISVDTPKQKDKAPTLSNKKQPIAKDEPTPKTQYERKPSGTVVDVSSKKNFFERKVQDIAESVLKTPKKKETGQKPTKAPVTSPVPPSPTKAKDLEEHTRESRTDSFMKSTLSSTVRSHTPAVGPLDVHSPHQVPLDNASEETPRPGPMKKTSRPDRTSPERKPSKPTEVSKPDEGIRRPERTSPERKPSRPDEVKRVPSKPEEVIRRPDRSSPERKPSRPTEITRTPSKPEEVIRKTSPERKTSKPFEVIKTPSKPDELIKRPDKINSERKISKPNEIIRTPSKPDEITRRADKTSPERKSSKPAEIIRSPFKPDDMLRRTSKTDDSSRRPSKPEDITKKTTKPQEITRKPTPTPSFEITKKANKSEEVAKKISKFEEVTKTEKVSRTDSFTKKTTSSITTRSLSPEKQPDELYERRDSQDRRPEFRTEQSYMRSTISSSQRAQTPDYHDDRPEERVPSRTDDIAEQRSDVEEELHQSRKESSYMRSTESSAARVGRRSSEDDTGRRKSVETVEETRTTRAEEKVGGKFGVTLRRTPSATKVPGKPTVTRQNSKPAEQLDIESVFDLSVLEEMLLKAVAYEERRRIRGQIRVVKKYIEEERNAAVLGKARPAATDHKRQVTTEYTTTERRRQTTSSERQPTPLPENKLYTTFERKSSDRRPLSSSPERRPLSSSPERRPLSSSPERRPLSSSPERRPLSSSPERRPLSSSPERRPLASSGDRRPQASSPERRPSDRASTERSPIRRTSNDRTTSTTSGYREGKVAYETTTTVRTQSVKRSSVGDVKDQNPTDLITSSYGVGPTDENGKPLFGLNALRRTSTNKALLDEKTEHETVVEEEEESSLFGLRALQTETMPAESSQLRELVERHQQYVKESSTKDVQPRQKPKAKLRDSFILTQEDEVSTPVIQSPDEPKKGLTLRSIIQKTDNSGAIVRSSMESRSTVVKSHSSVSSDGKVSLHRDVIHGEVSAKNGEEPTGKITRTSYSYQSPKDKESTPSIKSATMTSVIGGRRSSGPKIEEITDSSVSSDTNRRFSKEYTVEEVETVAERRRSSGLSVEENVKKYTSILKNSNQENVDLGKRSSGPRITELPEQSNNQNERVSFTKKTVTKTTDIPDSKTAFSTTKNEENKTETNKKVVARGDSVKALQHKFQQATVSSSLKQSSVERTDSKNKIQETKEMIREESRSSPTGKAKVTTTQEKSAVVQTSSRSEEPTSFLDNKTKVTGVQDILTRMRNADLVTEQTDTTEDAEARALLNKFLGASVILQGMEQGMKASLHQRHHSETEESSTAPASAALVSLVEKQRVKGTSLQTSEDVIDDITDEKQLRVLLEACSDYEGRRKLRARLRTIMAEQKGGTDDGEESHECTESSSSEVVQKGGTLVKTEVHTRTSSSSSHKLAKANSVQSPFAKFRQLERQNSAPSAGRPPPLYKFTEPKLALSASTIKERLLNWVQAQTRHYKNIQIVNFSTSWSNGMAFCALIHHFCPDAFDYDKLSPEKRRENLELAFRVAEEKADIYPLLDVEDMVNMRRPDWKCVFTYVQSIYRRFHDSTDALPVDSNIK